MTSFVDCSCCDGSGWLVIRQGCTRVQCHVCAGRGVIFRPRFLPPVPPAVPSSGGNRPLKGGESQIRKWIGLLAIVLVCLACSFDGSELRAPPRTDTGDAGAQADALSAPAADALSSDHLPPVDARPDHLPPVDWSALVDLAPPDSRSVNLCAGPVGTYVFGAACPDLAAGYPCWVERYDAGGSVGAPCFRDISGTAKAWYVSDCSQCAGVSP